MSNRNITFPVATGTPGAKSADEKLLDNDYVPDISANYGQVVTLHMGIGSVATLVQYTVDGGTSWHSFLNGEELKSNSALERQITLRYQDQLNFRLRTATDLSYLYVDLV